MPSNVATIPQPSITAAMAERYGMAVPAFEQTLRATVIPSTASREEFAAFLMVARQYNLNPVTREIYAFPEEGRRPAADCQRRWLDQPLQQPSRLRWHGVRRHDREGRGHGHHLQDFPKGSSPPDLMRPSTSRSARAEPNPGRAGPAECSGTRPSCKAPAMPSGSRALSIRTRPSASSMCARSTPSARRASTSASPASPSRARPSSRHRRRRSRFRRSRRMMIRPMTPMRRGRRVRGRERHGEEARRWHGLRHPGSATSIARRYPELDLEQARAVEAAHGRPSRLARCSG